jgi:hypothetical protein
MTRPNGLTWTAVLMAILNTIGWSVIVARTKLHMRIGLFILLILIFGIGYCVVWFYWKGRNWARIVVLLTSIVSVVDLISLASPRTKNPIIVATWGVFGVFLLYWLNTRPVRSFFAPGKAQLTDSGKSS